jgi:hypothetical protein
MSDAEKELYEKTVEELEKKWNQKYYY